MLSEDVIFIFENKFLKLLEIVILRKTEKVSLDYILVFATCGN